MSAPSSPPPRSPPSQNYTRSAVLAVFWYAAPFVAVLIFSWFSHRDAAEQAATSVAAMVEDIDDAVHSEGQTRADRIKDIKDRAPEEPHAHGTYMRLFHRLKRERGRGSGDFVPAHRDLDGGVPASAPDAGTVEASDAGAALAATDGAVPAAPAGQHIAHAPPHPEQHGQTWTPQSREEIVRNLTYQFLRTPGILLSGAILILLVLFFPGLFISAAFAARRDALSADSLDLEEHVRRLRARRWLDDESRSLIFRRVAFAGFVGLGCIGLLAPTGFESTFIGEFAWSCPSPGESSHPFFLMSYDQAPPYLVGFAGYYTYAVITLTNRRLGGTLTQRILAPLISRAIVVAILSVMLSGIIDGAGLARAVVFIAGVFPDSGIRYLAKAAQSATDDVGVKASFRLLPDLNSDQQAALVEVGVSSMVELAAYDWSDLIEIVGIDPRVLLGACDRALLLVQIGPDKALLAESLSLHTASDVVAYVRAGVAKDAPPDPAALQRLATAMQIIDAAPLAARLFANRNVAYILETKATFGEL